MSKRLVYLALMASLCSLCTVRAQEWNRAAFWDGAYRTNWTNEAASVALRDGLSAAGYQVLDAVQLKAWMNARIADGQQSVVVFCRDNAPQTVVETVDENCTLRKYLNAGGKIVWPADIPFWDIGLADGSSTNYGSTGSSNILGFYAANGTWDVGSTVTITEAGAVWGLTATWASTRPAVPDSVNIVLAKDSNGNAAAWVKHYLPNDTYRGFVRTYDTSASAGNIEDIIRLAEYREPYPYAAAVNPADGALIQETEYTLAWKAGNYATSHNVYFTDDLDALNAGSVEATSTTDTSLAVTGLVAGKTYYWRVDEIADGNPASPWEGAVWSFTVQALTAFNPAPADSDICVQLDQDLNWSSGLGAIFHSIYLSENYDEVANATIEGLQVADPTFDPETLEAGKTYYWRIDEFTPDEAGNLVIYPGAVWSFRTVPSVTIGNEHLVGWWTFDEGTSDTAVDSSGYGNHGALSGGIERIEGFAGDALQFGSGRVVNCGPDAAKQVTGDFTLATWVKLDRTNAGIYGGIGGKLQYLNSNYYGFGLVRHSGGLLRLWVGDGTADLAKSAVNSNATCVDIEWHHVAGVRSGQSNTLYVDGVLQNGTSTTGFVPSTDWFHIGRQYSTQTDRTFPGLIDDVRVYNVASNATTITQIMAGDESLAGDPQPVSGAVVDIRDVPDLAWSTGNTAASHDVYFGSDRQAVANADRNAAEFKGNQADASFSIADLVAFGDGDSYWRIDEVEADGVTVHKGYVWKLTVPAYLPVDDFESYTDNEDAGTAIFQIWIDGLTNGTGSYVGNENAAGGTFCEISVVHGGSQSMPFNYNNTASPYYSETERSWTTAQDWTAEGVDTLCLFVRGNITNAKGTLYIGLQDSANTLGVVTIADTKTPTVGAWTRVRIPLADFGVNPAKIKKMYLGIGDRDNPTEGGAGKIYIDDIRVIKQ